VDEELIVLIDQETHVNEDIMLEETGVDVRGSDIQEQLARIKELEELVGKLERQVGDLKYDCDMKDTYLEMYNDKIEALEKKYAQQTSNLEYANSMLEQAEKNEYEAQMDKKSAEDL